IKDDLKEERKKAALKGKEQVIRKLKQMKMSTDGEILERLRDYFNAATLFELYYKVGRGLITSGDFRMFKDYKPASPIKAKPGIGIADAKSVERELSKIKGRYEDILLVGEDMDVV